jgi:DNA-binding Xre family transcriptional regulator
MNKNIYDDIIDDFKQYFPVVAEDAVDWYPSGRHEITIKLIDQSKVAYNFVNKTMRNIPSLDDGIIRPENEWRRTFGSRLYDILCVKGWSQETLSSRSGISVVTISNYIRGKSIPSAYNLATIARALDCSINELTEFE